MIKTLTPQQAAEVIERGELDVVDVRAPAEWSSGHVPRARSVPLAELTGDPRGALPRDGVLFVCAKGLRSLKAAEAAEAAGLTNLYNLEGGTAGWIGAGLPVVAG